MGSKVLPSGAASPSLVDPLVPNLANDISELLAAIFVAIVIILLFNQIVTGTLMIDSHGLLLTPIILKRGLR